jgi:hypothetical protein
MSRMLARTRRTAPRAARRRKAPARTFAAHADGCTARIAAWESASLPHVRHDFSRAPILAPASASITGRKRDIDAAAAVDEAVRSPAQSLDGDIRANMEQRFGRDLGAVRVHTGERAAQSARAVNARAYTVGPHVVFAAAQYQPKTPAGRRLLAHELVHVLQQDASGASAHSADLDVVSATDPSERQADMVAAHVLRGGGEIPRLIPARSGAVQRVAADRREGTLPHREATELVRCIDIMGEETEPATCTPNRPLTWADFTGTPPTSPSFSAWTVADIREVAFSPPGGFCRHEVLGEPLEVRRKFQAFLDGSASWVLPKWANATDPAANGCDQQITDCQTFFNGQTAAGLTGGDRRLSTPPGCPAAIPYPASAVAHSFDECESVLRPACMTREPLESARLLHHEQGHFDIACKLAEKANAAVAAGGDPDALLRGAKALLRPTTSRYDADTRHGCDPGAQSTWDGRIAAGLPTINVVPIQQPAPRRRTRRTRP